MLNPPSSAAGVSNSLAGLEEEQHPPGLGATTIGVDPLLPHPPLLDPHPPVPAVVAFSTTGMIEGTFVIAGKPVPMLPIPQVAFSIASLRDLNKRLSYSLPNLLTPSIDITNKQIPMTDPANCALDLTCHDDDRKQASTVYQFHSMLTGWTYDSQDMPCVLHLAKAALTLARGIAAHVHAAHIHPGGAVVHGWL